MLVTRELPELRELPSRLGRDLLGCDVDRDRDVLRDPLGRPRRLPDSGVVSVSSRTPVEAVG